MKHNDIVYISAHCVVKPKWSWKFWLCDVAVGALLGAAAGYMLKWWIETAHL